LQQIEEQYKEKSKAYGRKRENESHHNGKRDNEDTRDRKVKERTN
jgi:hypothetical protein